MTLHSALPTAASNSASARILQIGASRNFRHMGGYRTSIGSVTRGDRLFRSDWLDLSREDDAARFRSLDIRQIFDFRSDAERARRPLVVPHDRALRVYVNPIEGGSMRSYLAQVATLDPASVDCKSAMTSMYYEMLGAAEAQLRSFFRELAAEDGPVLMMCTTGKDRTGVASALLLTALGVGHEDVMADYLISAAVYRGHEDEFARRHGYDLTGHSLDKFRDVFTVHPQYLEAVWQRAADVAGSMQTFIDRALVERGAERRLRERFTRPLEVVSSEENL